MKMDWGKILFIAMALFIVMIVAMGIKMATSQQSLYEENYYEQGENHEARMKAELEAKNLQFTFKPQTGEASFVFDSTGYVTMIKLIQLADEGNDMLIVNKDTVPVTTYTTILETNKGGYILEMEGVVNGKAWFKKHQFIK
jgi:hypothetical protein